MEIGKLVPNGSGSKFSDIVALGKVDCFEGWLGLGSRSLYMQINSISIICMFQWVGNDDENGCSCRAFHSPY